MKPLKEKLSALVSVSKAADDTGDLYLAKALLQANRRNIELYMEIQRLQIENKELSESVESLRDFVRCYIVDDECEV